MQPTSEQCQHVEEIDSVVCSKVRQTRFMISHQPLSRFACGRAVIIHSLLLANAICTRQIYSTTTIKSGHVTVWKVIMTVEAAGLRGSGH